MGKHLKQALAFCDCQLVQWIKKICYHSFFKPVTHPQPARGRLWVHAWFTEIVLRKVCLCVPIDLCTYACLSVRTHVSETLN